MSQNIKEVLKFFENNPYGKDSKSSEIWGKQNQQVINKEVAYHTDEASSAMSVGNKEKFNYHFKMIRDINKWLENMERDQEEFAVNIGGGQGGSNMFSNFTNLEEFDIPFFTGKGKISFPEDHSDSKPMLSVIKHDEETGETYEIIKSPDELTQDWVVKGDEDMRFQKLHQLAVKERNTMGVPLSFNPDYEIDVLLSKGDNWKKFLADKVFGRYMLQDWIMANDDKIKSGEIEDEKLHPRSFNPEYDTRLHEYFSGWLKKAFDPNYLTPSEQKEADDIIAGNNTEKTKVKS